MGLEPRTVMSLLAEGRPEVFHGPVDRYPSFMRPTDGELSTIRKIENCPEFFVGFRDPAGRYHQNPGAKGKSPVRYYDKGDLVVVCRLHEISTAASKWMNEWTCVLNVASNRLRLQAWASKRANGIDWHFDCADVIHFQITGEKQFRLLPTPETKHADNQTKRFERILAHRQNFDSAAEHIVRAGTITVIPRGVWHWSNALSDESYAVSLCIDSVTMQQVLFRALNRRLRLSEAFRAPLVGSDEVRRSQISDFADQAATLLRDIDYRSLLTHEIAADELPQDFNSAFFYIGMRGNAELDPLRLLVDVKELTLPEDDRERALWEAICRLGNGFRLEDLRNAVACAEPVLLEHTLGCLIKEGFLDFFDR